IGFGRELAVGPTDIAIDSELLAEALNVTHSFGGGCARAVIERCNADLRTNCVATSSVQEYARVEPSRNGEDDALPTGERVTHHPLNRRRRTHPHHRKIPMSGAGTPHEPRLCFPELRTIISGAFVWKRTGRWAPFGSVLDSAASISR